MVWVSWMASTVEKQFCWWKTPFFTKLWFMRYLPQNGWNWISVGRIGGKARKTLRALVCTVCSRHPSTTEHTSSAKRKLNRGRFPFYSCGTNHRTPYSRQPRHGLLRVVQICPLCIGMLHTKCTWLLAPDCIRGTNASQSRSVHTAAILGKRILQRILV